MLIRIIAVAAVACVCATNSVGEAYLSKNAQDPAVQQTASGLQFKVLHSGVAGGKMPGPTSPCVCNYRGTLIDGAEFDSSYRRGRPASTRRRASKNAVNTKAEMLVAHQ